MPEYAVSDVLPAEGVPDAVAAGMFLEAVRRWAAEQGALSPSPNILTEYLERGDSGEVVGEDVFMVSEYQKEERDAIIGW